MHLSRTGDATASNGGLANTGYLAIDHLTLVGQAAPRAFAAWPHQVGVLPPPAQSFQHRTEVDRLRDAVNRGGTAVLTQVLTGTGGVGKTQLAADYARTAWDSGEVDILLWISASSRSAITAGYAQAGVEVLAADPGNPEQAARAFLAWLEHKANQNPCRWLVVLDDLADPADMRGWWPPTNRHGRALVTTRRREAALTGEGRRRVTVGLFAPQEASAYLTAVLAAHDRHEPGDQINSLAADLGYLPLALAQAAAHIIDANLTCSSYRELLANKIRKLTDLLPEPGALPDDQTTNVAATWALSIERANQLRPVGLAGPMLQLAAFLDPNGIPATVLTSEPALAYLTEHRDPLSTSGTHQPAEVSAEDAVLALRALHRLSLIDHDPGTPHQAVRVHQLVQRATRDTLSPERNDQLAMVAADGLTASWPDIERDIALARSLRANASTLARTAEDVLYQPPFHVLLFLIGLSLGRSGQAANARDHFQHLADMARNRLGPDHSRTRSARHHLAEWQGEAGDAAGAAAAYEELLADLSRVLGQYHRSTLLVRSHLAYWRGRAGDVVDAITILEEVLADQKRTMRRYHDVHTLSTRSRLAQLRGRAGNIGVAVTELKSLLSDQKEKLGSDHPSTLRTRHELAHLQAAVGDTNDAAAAFEELLGDQVRVLGPDHPDALSTRHELAHVQSDAVAAAAFEELLADQVRVLGPDHPSTLRTRHELAHLQGAAGNANDAAAAFEELLADRVRVLGPDHPDTLNALDSQARWLVQAGDVAGAVATFRELLDGQVRVFLADDRLALGTCHELAELHGRAGIADGTETEELLAARLRVLGPDHPLTLSSRCTLLAQRHRDSVDVDAAIAAFEELLAEQLRVLRPSHPVILSTRNNLAYWQAVDGDVFGAADTYGLLLPKLVKVLGSGHPDTLAACHNLAQCEGRERDANGVTVAYRPRWELTAPLTGLLLSSQVQELASDNPHILAARNEISRYLRGAYNRDYGHLIGFIEE
ncbi:tetratricopeptide repeat protein [Streptomyces sp. NPDC006641]|uniref:tetratricopeptide repeat protein n=1 Tax=Streptomyces sp. NPDC006641 TaxID=3364755 RepID=UPI0036C8A1A9